MTRLPRDRREITRNLLERPGPRGGTLEKVKGDPAHSRRIPLPKYTVPLTPGMMELSLTPPIQPRATSHHEQREQQLPEERQSRNRLRPLVNDHHGERD